MHSGRLWPCFSEFMGTIKFKNYIPKFSSGTVRVEDKAHPCMKGVPESFIISKNENRTLQHHVSGFLAWWGITRHPKLATYDIAEGYWPIVHEKFSEEEIWGWCRESLIECARYAGSCARSSRGNTGRNRPNRSRRNRLAPPEGCYCAEIHPPADL